MTHINDPSWHQGLVAICDGGYLVKKGQLMCDQRVDHDMMYCQTCVSASAMYKQVDMETHMC